MNRRLAALHLPLRLRLPLRLALPLRGAAFALALVVGLVLVLVARRARADDGRPEPYRGGDVPRGMHVEDRYAESPWGPLGVGVPLFATSYGLLVPVWAAPHQDEMSLAWLAVPVAGPTIGGVALIAGGLGDKTSGWGGLVALAGTVLVADGALQCVGLVEMAIGFRRLDRGRTKVLVRDDEPRRARVTIEPWAPAARSAGLRLTISGAL